MQSSMYQTPLMNPKHCFSQTYLPNIHDIAMTVLILAREMQGGDPAELRSLQATAPEGFGSSGVSNSSSFTSWAIKFTKAASCRSGRRSFCSKPSRQRGQPVRCPADGAGPAEGVAAAREPRGVREVARAASAAQAQGAQERLDVDRKQPRPGPARAERSSRLSFVSPGRLLPRGSCRVPESRESAGTGEDARLDGSALIFAPLETAALYRDGPSTRLCPIGAPHAGQKAQYWPSSSSAGDLVRGFGLTVEMNSDTELPMTWP